MAGQCRRFGVVEGAAKGFADWGAGNGYDNGFAQFKSPSSPRCAAKSTRGYDFAA
jgi:hypothetical protein